MMRLLRLLTRLLPPKNARIVAGVVIMRGDDVILVQEGAFHKGKRWGLPAGRVDRGERIADAAAREALEETGLRVRITSLAGIYRYRPAGVGHSIRFIFLAEIAGGEPRADGREILDVRWFPIDDVIEAPPVPLRNQRLTQRLLRDVRSGAGTPLALLRDFVK